MVICLVTGRRRLAAAIGAAPGRDLEVLSEQIAAAAAAGIDFVQIREPDLEARALTAFVRSVMGKLRGSGTKLLVNDRLDVALAAGADGVHLKESSMPPDQGRRLAATVRGNGFVIACAVHTPFTATARSSADLIIAGTVQPTVSKPAAEYLEWKGLEEVVIAVNGTPVLGIGGLDLDSIPRLAATGAAGLAAIGAFIPPAGQAGISEFVKKRVTQMRFIFDSAQSDP